MRLLAMLGVFTVLVAAAPAQAATILQFDEHPGVLAGLGHTDITEIEEANEAELGFKIDFLGTLDDIDSGGTWDPNTSLNPEFALLNPIFTCTSGPNNDCPGNFTVDIDFSVLTNPDWQLVKIVVKAGNDPLEDWLTPLVAHDPQQQGVVSPRGPGSHGVSHILLWGRSETDTEQVPGPASLILVGMGVIGLGALVRRRSR